MRRYVVSMITTVDGFHEGPGRDMMAMPFDDGFSRHNVTLLRRAGTVVSGRRGYDGGEYWARITADDAQPAIEREIGRIQERLAFLVVSDMLRIDEAWPAAARTTVVPRREAVDAVRALKEGDGGDLVSFGSATTWGPLLEAGLVDELDVLVGPALLGGGGTPLFRGGRVPLRLLDSATLPDSQLVRLRFAPA